MVNPALTYDKVNEALIDVICEMSVEGNEGELVNFHAKEISRALANILGCCVAYHLRDAPPEVVEETIAGFAERLRRHVAAIHNDNREFRALLH
jgi:hypothetical protein